MTGLAPLLQAFFTTRLTGQYGASVHTIAAYRDTWRLLLRYAATTTGTAPAALDLTQVNSDLISGFLTYLETDRGNTISTSGTRANAMPKLNTSCDCTSAWVACRPAISTTTAGTSVIRRRIVGVILGETRS